MFDTRAFIANQLGCAPEEFTIVRKPVEGYRGMEADYAGDRATVRVLISKPRLKSVAKHWLNTCTNNCVG